MTEVELGSRGIGSFSAPYIIAEIGVNHENSLPAAFKMIDEAKSGGADAAKFQTYSADLLAMKDSPAYWDRSEEPTATQHELFSKFDSFGPEEYVKLADHCRKVGIDFMSTPFDIESAVLLKELVSVFKVASADITNIPLLRYVGSTNKPVILSTGASTLDEIREGVRELREAGAPDVILLHCILSYPTEECDANLQMVSHLRKSFPDLLVGLSDHTRPTRDHRVSVIAYALGARVIEKHFTLNKNQRGNDHYHSMDTDDLRKLVSNLESARTLLGSSSRKEPIESEALARKHARRSLCASDDLPAGHVVRGSDLIALRPVAGIPASEWDRVVGRELSTAVSRGRALQWSNLVGEPVGKGEA